MKIYITTLSKNEATILNDALMSSKKANDLLEGLIDESAETDKLSDELSEKLELLKELYENGLETIKEILENGANYED